MMWLVAVCVAVLLAAPSAEGHGRLIQPPGRSTCWRYGFDQCVPNYTDQELFCGGFAKQWEQNGGKCGVCGDNWSDEQPRANEAGGTYGKGVIVDTYSAGQTIEIKVELTAAHFGYFEFRLCKNDDTSKIITHECLNQNLLELESGGTRYLGPLNKPNHKYVVRAKLPAGLTCSQCVLQWKYNTGNRWGCDKDDNTDCDLGKGPQEQFYGCADITIS